MTLSRFLRDYLYIPLGGNRHGAARRYVNLMITMLLGGLWHGAAWTFVIWGGMHGIYLLVNHAWRSGSRTRAGHVPGRALRRAAPDVHRRRRRLGLLPRRERGHRRSLLRSMAGGHGVSLPRAWLAPLVARWGGAYLTGWASAAWGRSAAGRNWDG